MYQRDLSYRIYVTDILRASTQWEKEPERWFDLVDDEPKEYRTADEIVLDVLKRTGIEVI